jgi:hypothetical protein
MKLLENVVFKGIVSFFLFLIFWSLGYVLGYICTLLGLRRELRELLELDDEEDELEDMIKTMNEMGPNN